MSRSFTYESRVTYLDPDSALKTVTGNYVGPEQILICLHQDGSFDQSDVPETGQGLGYTLDDLDPPGHTDSKWMILDQTNDDHVILMDMLTGCEGATPTWQITTVKEITLSDATTYTMQYRNPVDDDTLHTFAIHETSIDYDSGEITFVRTQQWATREAIQNQAEQFMLVYRGLYDNAVSDAAKQKYKNLLEIYEIIDTDLAITYPRLNEIEFPDLASLAQGSTFPSE
jgi:hypothetical protein